MMLIGALSPELAPWAAGCGLKHLDTVGPVQTNVTFAGVEDLRTTVVALIHPSLRNASLRHRRYGRMLGAGAELAMLRDGLAAMEGRAKVALQSIAAALRRTESRCSRS